MKNDSNNKKSNSKKQPVRTFGSMKLIGNKKLIFPHTDAFDIADLENLDMEDIEYPT